MATACLRLVTLAPVRPLWSSPRFISWSAVPTFRWLDLLYFPAMAAGLLALRRGLHKLPIAGVVPALSRLRCALHAVLPLLLLYGCSTGRADFAAASGGPVDRAEESVYVVKRAWHTDIGFAAKDLDLPLASLLATYPDAQYLLFGFGDRQYLIAKGPGGVRLLKALWPGPGVLLVTGLRAAPQSAFGDSNVVSVRMPAAQARRIQAFVWNSLSRDGGAVKPLLAGPYAGSLYYPSPQRYSLLHTCNTWVAQALASAGLPVRSAGVELTGQLWHQLHLLPRSPAAPATLGLEHAAACCSLEAPR
jgi:uncharacterized protein (TIGR02117 family)